MYETPAQSLDRSARHVLYLVNSLGWNCFEYRDRADTNWARIVAVHDETGERWEVEGTSMYEAACELAQRLGIDLEG